ncbi:MAG: efflux RND transporter permease subunit [Lentisphaerae bacterium]|nr:efflux RND transporter permease subunit [Lentisphaerota bacterium]
MNISEIFVRKPITTVLMTVVLAVMGVAAYLRLPVSSLPNVDSPVMTVSASYPGASPQTMASAVAGPLENELMSINGLQSIISDNTPGATKITLTFDLGKNIDLIAPDVQRAINAAQATLPADLPSPPTYDKNNPSDQPIMYVMVTSDTLTPGQVYDYAYRYISKRLSTIEGVSKVRLEASEYEDLVVAWRGQGPIYLRDVAQCLESVGNDKIAVRYGMIKRDAVWDGGTCLPISRAAGGNTVAVAATIRATLDQLREEIPGSVNIDIMYDLSLPIIESINDVQTTIVLAVVLVVLIIFLFLGRLRETLVPSAVLPIALLGTFIVMGVVGFSLDNLSLMALVLSVGFLVDDAIVVLENTIRHVEEGRKPVPAAIVSMRELTFTVVSTSVALIIVFVPLVFMAGVVGRNFKEFALTVIIAIVCSTILAMTLTPMMCSRILKPTGGHENRIQRIVSAVIGSVTRRYGVWLTFILRRKWISALLWIACIAGTIVIFQRLPKDFIPPGDSGGAFGVMMMPMGSSAEEMLDFQRKVEQVVMSNTNVRNVLTVANPNPGADKSTGYIVTVLTDEARPPIDEVMAELSRQLSGITDGMVFMEPIALMKLSAGGESKAMGSTYSYAMRGNDRDQLYQVAEQLHQKMQTLPGFYGLQTSVKLNMPQLVVRINHERAALYGITTQQILANLMDAYSGGRALTFYTDSDTYDVIPEVLPARARQPEDLGRLRVKSPLTGEAVPLAALAWWEETVGPQNVPHSQQLDSATLSFNLRPGVALGEATAALESAAQAILPPTISGQLQGEAQEFQEAIKSLVLLMMVSVFLMYVVLGILYESYIHPFTVLTTLPVAAFGGVATLWLFNQTCNLYAYIGLFMLLGIIAKNGIMMVDFAKQYLEEHPGATGFDAIHNACLIRFRPILMTGLSTIMGAMPIALGMGADGASRIPLGLIIVGGMVFAQVVTLFVTPGIFLYMEWLQERLTDSTRDTVLGLRDEV